MENDKKEESETRSYALSSNNLPSDPGEAIKLFEKNLEGLENLVKLFKSDVSKMFDISDSSFPISSIHKGRSVRQGNFSYIKRKEKIY